MPSGRDANGRGRLESHRAQRAFDAVPIREVRELDDLLIALLSQRPPLGVSGQNDAGPGVVSEFLREHQSLPAVVEQDKYRTGARAAVNSV